MSNHGDLERAFGVSRWTIAGAVTVLKDAGAITTRPVHNRRGYRCGLRFRVVLVEPADPLAAEPSGAAYGAQVLSLVSQQSSISLRPLYMIRCQQPSFRRPRARLLLRPTEKPTKTRRAQGRGRSSSPAPARGGRKTHDGTYQPTPRDRVKAAALARAHDPVDV